MSQRKTKDKVQLPRIWVSARLAEQVEAAAQAQAVSQSQIIRQCVADGVTRKAPGTPLSLRELEIWHIKGLLRDYKNITMVAKILEIDRRTLQRKLRGLDWRE